MRSCALLFLLAACDGSSSPSGADDLSVSDLGAVDQGGVDFSGADFAMSQPDLTVVPAVVTIQIYNQQNQPDTSFVMWQDGAGPWQALPHQASGSYTLSITDSKGRYGFAAGDVSIAGSPVGFLLQAAVSDGANLVVYLGAENAPLTKSVQVTALDLPQSASVQIGPVSFPFAPPSQTQMFTLPSGSFDILGLIPFPTPTPTPTPSPSPSPSPTPSPSPSPMGALIYRRGFDATVASPSPAPFDFASGEVLAAQMNALSITGAQPNLTISAQSLLVLHDSLRSDSEVALFSQALTADVAGNASVGLPFLPNASVIGTDVQSVSATAFLSPGIVYAQSWINHGADQTLALPPAFNFTLQTWAQSLPHFEFDPIAGSHVYLVEWTAGNSGADTLRWHTFITPAWLDGAYPSYSFPSLSGVSGWDAKLMPMSGSPAGYQGTAMTYGSLNRSFTALLPGAYKPKAGETLRKSSSQSFTTGVP